MQASLIQGLREVDMQAVVNAYMLKDWIYPNFFPLQFTPTLTWKAIEGNIGVPVAADVVAYNASAPLKTREVVSKLTGDIPKIEISFKKDEDDINQYNQLNYYQSMNPNNSSVSRQILDWIYGDMQKCFDGVNARLEWLAMKALSTGKVVLSSATNGKVVTETAVDFLVPSANKAAMSGSTTIWSAANAATALPITDIRAVVKTAKTKGYRFGAILMDQDTFDIMRNTAEVIKYSANWVVNATNIATMPSLDSVNQGLRGENMPPIVIIDTYVTIETLAGVRTTSNPWQTGSVVFVPSIVVGATYHAPSAYDTNKPQGIQQVRNNHVLLQKYSEDKPLVEFTAGLCNGIPILSAASRIYMLDVAHTPAWTF